MNNIFSTEERIKILRGIVFRTGTISVNATAGQLGLSKGLVSKYCNILTHAGVLKKTAGRFTVSGSPLVKGIKILLNIKSLSLLIFKQYPFVISVGLYGSCAKGENTEDSDMDLWIELKMWKKKSWRLYLPC
jgi:predicted transcriptional regulator